MFTKKQKKLEPINSQKNSSTDYPTAYRNNVPYELPSPVPMQAQIYATAPTTAPIQSFNIADPSFKWMNVNTACNPHCKECGSLLPPLVTRKVGSVGMLWCLGLFLTTGVCCFWPFVMDGCKTSIVQCAGCGAKISEIPADCC